MIFPLPLVPFEEYMLIDDRPTHPMSFFFKLAFCGTCDPTALDAALQVALRWHPLLAAIVTQPGKNRFEWSATEPQHRAVQWVPDDPNESPIPATAFDLFREPGLRVLGRSRESATGLQFQFHHSCCDAIGALRFVEDLLVAYAAAIDGDANLAKFRSIDEHRLRDRGRFELTRWKLVRMARKQAVGLLGAGQFLMRQPVPVKPIVAGLANAKLPNVFPAAQTHEFSEAETAGLFATARELKTTVNNVLIRDLFLALGDFRLRRQLGHDRDWLRLSIPMNLRSGSDETQSAANVVSMIFLDRRPHEFSDRKTLLAGIDAEMNLIKRNQLGFTFPLSLRFTRSLPGAISRMRRMSKKEVCRGTAVLSNLVRPFTDAPLPRRDGRLVAGGLTLERIEFLPPVRPHTLAAFGVLTYAERLNVALHFDPRGLTEQDASELLRNVVNRVGQSIQPA